ncbi:MAG: sugar phosphate nucleotidyltransferase [Candidatus Roizmanbacteria bacterium]
MRKIKNGLILAGGDSTRFWPLSEKTLLSFLGKPLLLYQIEELSKFCDKITVVIHKDLAFRVKRLIENSYLKDKVQIIIQKDILSNQVGAILSAKNHIKGEVLIVNANDIIDFNIISKLINRITPKTKILLTGKKINEYFPGGYFKFDSKGNLSEIIEKPQKDNLPSNVFRLVLDFFSDINQLIETIESIKTNKDDHYEKSINKILTASKSNHYLIYENYWNSLKYPWHVLTMLKWFLGNIKTSKISPSAHISKKAVINGPVIIGDNVRVGDFVKITGPVFIGNNSVIGDYSLIRESQIGEDCLIGSYTEVARSYIGNKVFLHRNYIGDSVLDNKIMMGAQAVTANLRFDGETVSDTNLSKLGAFIGQESKIGVNTTLTPGVKIGRNTWIGPGEVILKDIKDKIYFISGVEKVNLNK